MTTRVSNATVQHARGLLTGWVGSVLLRRLTGFAKAHIIQCQNPEGVVRVGRQVQTGRGLVAGNLRHVDPDALIVERVLILNEEL